MLLSSLEKSEAFKFFSALTILFEPNTNFQQESECARNEQQSTNFEQFCVNLFFFFFFFQSLKTHRALNNGPKSELNSLNLIWSTRQYRKVCRFPETFF